EMAFRRMARYSPFYFHVLFTISSEDVRKCLDATSHIHETLAGAMSGQSIIVGHSSSPIERITRQHSFQILLKYQREPAVLDILTALDEEYHEKYKKEGISLKIDVNPLVIM